MAYPRRQPLRVLTPHKHLQVEAADEVIRRLTPPAPFTTRGGQYEGNLCGWFRPVQIADLLDPRCRNAAGVIHISGSAMWTSSSPGLWILSTQPGYVPLRERTKTGPTEPTEWPHHVQMQSFAPPPRPLSPCAPMSVRPSVYRSDRPVHRLNGLQAGI